MSARECQQGPPRRAIPALHSPAPTAPPRQPRHLAPLQAREALEGAQAARQVGAVRHGGVVGRRGRLGEPRVVQQVLRGGALGLWGARGRTWRECGRMWRECGATWGHTQLRVRVWCGSALSRARRRGCRAAGLAGCVVWARAGGSCVQAGHAAARTGRARLHFAPHRRSACEPGRPWRRP